MPSDIVSISSKEISAAVREAVARNKQLSAGSDNITINPVIIIGKMLARDPNTSLQELQDQAADLAKSLPSAVDSRPVVLVYDQQVIVGFTQPPMTLLKD